MWRHLMHPNVLSLLGITISPPQLISNWMSGGDLPRYVKNNSDADLLGLVGVPPVSFIACLSPSPVIRCREWPLLPSLPQCDSWGHQGRV